MILMRNLENITFYHFNINPRFPPFLLYVRCKSGVTFVRRCSRDANFVCVDVGLFDVVHGIKTIVHHFYLLAASGNLFLKYEWCPEKCNLTANNIWKAFMKLRDARKTAKMQIFKALFIFQIKFLHVVSS